jgi:parallel beta-helix repeat protein
LIRNNVIEGSPGGIAGIGCDNSSSPVISGNKITGGDGGSSTIWVDRSSPSIVNNRLFCGTGAGSGIWLHEASSAKIANNIIEDSGDDGIGIWIRNSSDIAVINNTINTNGKGLNEEGSSAIVMNNIITGNDAFGIHISSSSTLSYNDIWGNATNYHDTSPGDNDISADPLFVDESSGDYHLSMGSPCIDAGNPDPEYDDLDGSRNDMGAYGGPGADSTWISYGGITLSIPSMEVSPEDTVHLPISGNSISGVADIEVTLSYASTILSFLDAKTTAITQGFSLTKTTVAANTVSLSMSSPIGINDESGDIVEIKFTVSETAKTGSYIRFEYASVKDEVANERTILVLEDGEIHVTTAGIEESGGLGDKVPISYNLYQNYPNPFNPSTTIRFSIPQGALVQLTVYDILGREVETILKRNMDPGHHMVQWDASHVASGIYFVRMVSGDFRQTRKVMVLR